MAICIYLTIFKWGQRAERRIAVDQLKPCAFREAEDRAQELIYSKFGLPLEMLDDVDWADRVMVRFEGKQGFGDDFFIDHSKYPSLEEHEIKAVGKWAFWSWKQSREAFLLRFRLLTTD